jgi:hypothetical protein
LAYGFSFIEVAEVVVGEIEKVFRVPRPRCHREESSKLRPGVVADDQRPTGSHFKKARANMSRRDISIVPKSSPVMGRRA